MITPDQFKHLHITLESAHGAVKDSSKTSNIILTRNLEVAIQTLARIQSEEVSERASAQSDDEAAAWCAVDPGILYLRTERSHAYAETCFLRGCARYRPLVEELVYALTEGDQYNKSQAIAHAKKTMGVK